MIHVLPTKILYSTSRRIKLRCETGNNAIISYFLASNIWGLRLRNLGSEHPNNMANIPGAGIPSTKLSDGTSIPLVSAAGFPGNDH